MIIEQHYDDEVLIGLIDEADKDAHVPACDTCSGTLESYRDLSAGLHDGSVWDERELSEAPSPKTANFLRDFAARSKAEDLAARPIVAKLAADPSLIDQHPEWRTAGVVRGLLKHVDSINFTDPKSAVALAQQATDIADSIASSYTSLSVLRAKAWREYGWALYFVGSFEASLSALDRAEEYIALERLADCDRAEISLVRARVYRDIERFDDAVDLARKVAHVFRTYGNHQRAAVAEGIESGVLICLGRHREAIQIDSRIANDCSLEPETRACALNRTAWSFRELRDFEEARKRYARAIAEFERLGLAEKRSMARWGLARVLLAEGSNAASALSVLEDLRSEFAEMGMSHDLALASIDTSEALIVLNRAPEVAEICRDAIEYFRTAGLAYSAQAMTALSYLRESTNAGRLTPETVRHVRTYFEILPKQPHLLFAFSL
ncbi:MAG TPA: hypothetical protein VL284_19835 [Thermoanaerobaculia bacterium]|nr:hypothetical protein [Thermoanaerobaculia bacterium]